MVNRDIILKTINNIVEGKCGNTISSMHNFLDGLNHKEKVTLLKYSGENIDEYEDILKDGDEEEIFEFEKTIFDTLGKKQRDNILQYLTDFNEKSYSDGDENLGEYPDYAHSPVELRQREYQESQGYNPEIIYALQMWTGGWYDGISHYSLNKDYNLPEPVDDEYSREVIRDSVKGIDEYISNHDLVEDSILYRGGHWDVGMKVGDVGTIPLINSTSYHRDTAFNIGIDDRGKDKPYMIKIYAPKGTHGVYVNAPSLMSEFPEHEILLGKNQKYIVLEVNDYVEKDSNGVAGEATILLIND